MLGILRLGTSGTAIPYADRVPASEELLERVARLCRGDHSAKALRERVLQEVRRSVPFDAHVFPLTDPATKVATSPLADVPMLPWPQLPSLIRWRYLTLVNRWDRLPRSAPSTSLLGSGRPEDSAPWHHVQRDLGVVDTCVTALADQYGYWGFLELWRTTAPFQPGEVALLGSLAATIATGLRKAAARTFVGSEDQLPHPGPAVVVLTPELAVHAQTPAAADALLRLNPPDEPMAPIPAAAYNIGGALLAAEAGIPVGAPWSRVHLGANRWVTLRADRMGELIAVSIEPSTLDERMDLFARAHGLSARETEVLGLLARGLDTGQLAAALVLSEHTVNDHVKSVLAKTGSRTRAVLLARISGSAV